MVHMDQSAIQRRGSHSIRRLTRSASDLVASARHDAALTDLRVHLAQVVHDAVEVELARTEDHVFSRLLDLRGNNTTNTAGKSSVDTKRTR